MTTVMLRPPRDSDIPRLVEIERADAEERGVESTTTPDEIRIAWETPGFDRERHATVAEVANQIVGTAQIYAQPDSDQTHGGGFVLPAHRGNGVGSALLRWTIEAARAIPGKAEFRTGADTKVSGALALIESFGFEFIRTWFRMANPQPGDLPEPQWPDGIELRHLQGDALIDAAVAAWDGSFIDHYNFHPANRDEWAHWVNNDPTFDPTLLHFAFDGETLAGFCNTTLLRGSVLRGDLGPIGTMRAYRGIGLGRALLRHATREIAARGAVEVSLGVDSENPNGAVRLYSNNGYKVTNEARSYRLKL